MAARIVAGFERQMQWRGGAVQRRSEGFRMVETALGRVLILGKVIGPQWLAHAVFLTEPFSEIHEFATRRAKRPHRFGKEIVFPITNGTANEGGLGHIGRGQINTKTRLRRVSASFIEASYAATQEAAQRQNQQAIDQMNADTAAQAAADAAPSRGQCGEPVAFIHSAKCRLLQSQRFVQARVIRSDFDSSSLPNLSSE